MLKPEDRYFFAALVVLIAVLIGLGFEFEPSAPPPAAVIAPQTHENQQYRVGNPITWPIGFLRWFFHDVTGFATLLLAWVTWRLTVIAVHQDQLGRDTFNASHRAKIIVRVERMERPTVGQPLDVHYRITNIGGTRATLVSVGAEIEVRDREVWRFDTLPIQMGPPPKAIFDKGESELYLARSRHALTQDQWTQLLSTALGKEERTHICIFGRIRYEDALGFVRRTGFFRIYDGRSGHFRISENPDHEYQD